MSKRKKVRVDFRKNRGGATRDGDLTRKLHNDPDADELGAADQRIRAKGDLSRKRTIMVDEGEDGPALPTDNCLRGRVLTTNGLLCVVVTDDGQSHRCYIRRLLKSMASDERSVVATGDWVWFRPAPAGEGMVVRVEPRKQVLTRGYRRREQIICANIEQALIVGSVANPQMKPGLIDRYLVSAGRGELRPILCLNKVDLAESWRIQPIAGLYSQLGYKVILTSATTGQGIESLRAELVGKETVVVGRSGVGKSSLLNALEPKFHLKVNDISDLTHKGKHTTTSSQLLQLTDGGSIVDTPGIRQFELWEVPADEVEGYYIDLLVFAGACKFAGCRHDAEDYCAVKTALAEGYLSYSRYESYLKMVRGEPD